MHIDFMNVRTIGSLVLLAGGLVTFIGAVTHRGRGIIIALVILAAGGFFGYQEYQYQVGQNTMLADVQKVYNNTSIVFHCERYTERLLRNSATDDTYMENNPTGAYLYYEQCATLNKWFSGDKTSGTTDDTAAVYYLAQQIDSEALKNGNACGAIQDLKPLLVGLGAQQAVADAMFHDYYVNVFEATDGHPNCIVAS